MARIRTIKPEFFTSEDIVELSPLARLLFVAMWCEADREGRLEWKPATFKIRYLPGDNCDVHALARELTREPRVQNASGTRLPLVVLYGDGLAWIPTFKKHQAINGKESASRLPPYSKDLRTREARVADASGRVEPISVGREGKGTEGKGKEEDISAASAAADAKQVGLFLEANRVNEQAEQQAKTEKKPRALSEWQRFVAEDLAPLRAAALPNIEPDTTLGPAEINAQIKRILTEHGKPAVLAAYRAMLADPWARGLNPPCPLQAFVSGKKLPGYLSAGRKASPPPGAAPKSGGWHPDNYKRQAVEALIDLKRTNPECYRRECCTTDGTERDLAEAMATLTDKSWKPEAAHG